MNRSNLGLTRRELIQSFGLAAFVLHPVIRSMAWAAGGNDSLQTYPRFVMFFKGGAFIPSSTNPSSIQSLSGTSIAPLQPYAGDIVLFKNMNIHGGEPKSNGYQEEHGAGLMGCVTGNSYKYSANDAYFAYTDHESIDISIANHYQTVRELNHLVFPSLHLGSGAHSDSDDSGQGQRYISFRKRKSGDGRYSNAIQPMQDAGQVYDLLMKRIGILCNGNSNTPNNDQRNLRNQLERKKSVIDLVLGDIQNAKRRFGMDSEHSQKLEGLLESWRQTEKTVTDQLANSGSNPPSGSTKPCPQMPRPTGNGARKYDLDKLSPVHDQMISLIHLAFEWDLTRVVAFTSSGASCGQYIPSRGVNDPRHSLEHAGNTGAMLKLDQFHSEKFGKLLGGLKKIDDGNGKNALNNSSIVLGMECWSTGGHYLTNIPFVFAGQGGGRFKTGRIINAGGRNNNDLLISCRQASGIQSNVFGLESLCKGPIL